MAVWAATTDLQCLALLWQDVCRGLQRSGEWILAPPVEGTCVVTLSDADHKRGWLSTVHPVALNTTPKDWISMPFFFARALLLFLSELGRPANQNSQVSISNNEAVSVSPSCVRGVSVSNGLSLPVVER